MNKNSSSNIQSVLSGTGDTGYTATDNALISTIPGVVSTNIN